LASCGEAAALEVVQVLAQSGFCLRVSNQIASM
jgi:hypothetical protein